MACCSRLGAALEPPGGMLDMILSREGICRTTLEAVHRYLGPFWNEHGPSWPLQRTAPPLFRPGGEGAGEGCTFHAGVDRGRHGECHKQLPPKRPTGLLYAAPLGLRQ